MNKVILFLMLAGLFLPGRSQTVGWNATFKGLGDNRDQANDICSDNNGNIYVTGYTFRSGQDKDYITIKFNQNGDTIWTQTYGSLPDVEDEANAIAVASDGSVYVTGVSDNDMVTLKYNGSGTLLWTNIYSFAGRDRANDIAIDITGNIYITGRSDGDPSANRNYDYATIKYDPSGTELWVRRYDGGTDDDEALMIEIDGNGNPIVSGNSENGLFDDIVTIKYSSVGDILWEKRYDGGLDDDFSSMVIDNNNNIFVTGSFDTDPDAFITNNDIITIKYSSTGNEDWTSVYSGVLSDNSGDIKVDALGTAFVCGRTKSGSYDDFVLIKYDVLGNQIWDVTYDGIAHQDDEATELILDANSAYVVGKSDGDADPLVNNNDIVVIKYSLDGSFLWEKRLDGNAVNDDIPHGVVPDIGGNLIVAGEMTRLISQEDVFVVKLSSAGTVQWESFFNGIGEFSDNINSLTIKDRVYLTGYSFKKANNRDFLTIVYDTSGTLLWFDSRNSGGNGFDEANSVAFDLNGNVYVTGVGDSDYYTIKYNQNGDTLWCRILDNAGGYDEAVAIMVNSQGTVFVTGKSDADTSANVNEDYLTVAYNNAGSILWTANYNGSGNGKDRAEAMGMDSAGNVFVTGRSANIFDDDMVTIKYNSSGLQQWVRVFDGGFGNDRANAICVDDLGNVYITGRSMNPGDYDILTIKYDNNGNQLWTARYDGGFKDDPAGIQVDGTGNVYVTGSKRGVLYDDYVLIKYNSTGSELWSVSFDGSASQDDNAGGLAVSADGSVYTTGGSDSNPDILVENRDFVTNCYDQNGSQLWSDIFSGTSNYNDVAKAISIDDYGNLYVSGYTFNSPGDKDIYTYKFWINPFIENVNHYLIDERSIILFPNPASDHVRISFSDEFRTDDSSLEFSVYSLSGQEVAHIQDLSGVTVEVNLQEIHPGMYIYHLTRGKNERLESGKLIIK